MRCLPDFLDAYVAYADTGHAPRRFHVWAGLSLIASALERKVWLPWDTSYDVRPNLYVALVGKPASGKTSAITKVIGFVRDLNARKPDAITLFPSQMSEARMIDFLTKQKSFQLDGVIRTHASAFYHASEASNSLKPMAGGGDLVPCLTDFYDCHAYWEKSLMKDNGEKKALYNLCVNFLAGATFDYLGKLVTNENIMGGFASRLIYVIEHEQPERNCAFQPGLGRTDNVELRQKLVADLEEINSMAGAFTGDADVAKLWTSWYKTHQKELRGNPSEKMQSVIGRKETNLLKVCMIISASESSERVIRARHWEKALELVEGAEQDIPKMLRESQASNVTSQGGLNQALFRAFDGMRSGSVLTKPEIRKFLTLRGFDPTRVDATLTSFVSGGVLEVSGNGYRLLVDPNSHL